MPVASQVRLLVRDNQNVEDTARDDALAPWTPVLLRGVLGLNDTHRLGQPPNIAHATNAAVTASAPKNIPMSSEDGFCSRNGLSPMP